MRPLVLVFFQPPDATASVTDSLVTGRMEGTLTRYDADRTETRASFEASFCAVPRQIPPP